MELPLFCKGNPWHTIKSREFNNSLERIGMDIPQCKECSDGVLVPLSDYGPRGSDLDFKVWACINPSCGFTIRIDKGVMLYGLRVGESKKSIDQPNRS